jgi:hypothetical protein
MAGDQTRTTAKKFGHNACVVTQLDHHRRMLTLNGQNQPPSRWHALSFIQVRLDCADHTNTP